MKKIVLFGASGNLGRAIAAELTAHGFDLTVVVRNKSAATFLSALSTRICEADPTRPETLKGILDGHDAVISALGKSVSPNDRSKPSFFDVDFLGNSNILKEAHHAGIKKFVYISAFHAEKYLHLTYFKVHHDFSQRLIESGIDYSLIKPPAIFCAYLDMIAMASKGRLVNFGKGEKKTNPIFEGDLAKIVVESLSSRNAVIEAGGKNIYTRHRLHEIIQNEVNPSLRVRTIPLWLVKIFLPLIRLFDKNTFDKFSFFIEVIQHDTLAPAVGETTFESYIHTKTKNL